MKHTLKKICQASGILCENDLEYKDICVDSRLVSQGSIFFALPGNKVDGHKFLNEVAAKGAAAAFISQNYDSELPSIPCIRVPDLLAALQTMAKIKLQEQNPKIIAITGSLGKTTTKEFTKKLLQTKYKVASSFGNQNSQIGLPLSILNQLDGSEELLVQEMGMTGFNQISKLVQIAPPDIAAITSIYPVHIENFKSIEEIAKAKSEIFSHNKTKIAILHREMAGYQHALNTGVSQKFSFSLNTPDADFLLQKIPNQHGLQIIEEGKTHTLPDLSLIGDHNRHNLLAAIVIARKLDLSWDEIAATIPFLQLPERRLQIIEKNGVLFVNDSYNAAEASVIFAINSLEFLQKRGKRVAVLGDILELGEHSESTHRRVAEHALNKLDMLFCLGKESKVCFEVWKDAGRKAFWFLDMDELVNCLRSFITTDDVVLIKGSRLMQMWQVLEQY